MTDIPARVRKVIGETLGLVPDGIAADAHILIDLGADSLDLVEVVMDIEAEFGIEITDADMNGIGTVADVVAIVTRMTEGAASGGPAS